VLIPVRVVIESEAHAVETALALRDINPPRRRAVHLQASYDKANRTSGASFPRPGLAEGVRVLGRVREAGVRS
jgi:2-dehydro-3-deoxyphosphooctonate aldolase (KDO 8-P synthase)